MAQLTFQQLADRAEKRRHKGKKKRPYVLPVDGDKDIVIPYPDAIKSMEYEELTTVRAQLRCLTGAEFPRILELCRGRDVSVIQDLISDMWDFWDDDSNEVPGGKEA